MPANTLLTGTVVRIKESVENEIYNFSHDDAPLTSMIGREKISNVFHEWQRKSYRTPSATNASIEGADATYAAQTQPGMLNNRTQIVQDTLSVSGTTEAVKKYGRDSEINRLKVEKMVELKRDIEASIISSGAAVTGTSGVAGKLRGLYGFIATNDSLGATGVSPDPTTNTAPTAGTLRPLTEALVKAQILGAWTDGGKVPVAMVSPAHKQVFSTFTGNVQRTNEVNGKRDLLNTSFSVYGHDFGETKVVPNQVMATAGAGLANTLYLIDPALIKLGQLRPFQSKELAQVGDAQNFQILTEVTLIVKDEKPLAAVRDLTATGL